MSRGFFLCSAPSTQRLSINPSMLRCCHVIFKEPTLDAAPNLLHQDPWGGSKSNKQVSRTFHSKLIGSCISNYTTMPRDPDETHRDMIGFTVWNIFQGTAHFILTFICLRATFSYDLAHRAVRSWRHNSFCCFSQRWPWNTLRNHMCGVACCSKEWGEAFSSIFTTDTRSWSIPDWGVIL
jgi:hypothetical protein